MLSQRRTFDVAPSRIPTKRSRVIKSSGRGQPCAPQGNVVSTVRFVRPEDIHQSRLPRSREYERAEARAKEEARQEGVDATRAKRYQYAPIGTPEAFNVYKGELVYSLCQPNQYLNARQNVDRDAEEEIFSHVGGLGTDQEIRFAGCCDFSPHETSNDDEGTIARAGTRTVVNTGPNPINSGQVVYFSPFAYAAQEPDGTEPPLVREKGQPGDKYRPALYGLDGHDVYTALAGLRKQIDGVVARYKHDKKDAENTVAAVHKEIHNTWLVNHAVDFPARKYAEIYAVWSCLLHEVKPTDTSYTQKALIRLWYGDASNRVKAYLKSIGEDERVDAHPIFNTKDDALILEYTRDALEQAFSKQEHYLRSKCIGTCIRGGAPGQGIDILLGYHW